MIQSNQSSLLSSFISSPMEESNSKSNAADDNFFFDSQEDFPFYDSFPNFEPDSSSKEIPLIESKTSAGVSSPAILRRRRRHFSQQNTISSEPSLSSPVNSSDITPICNISTVEGKNRFSRKLKESEKSFEKSSLLRDVVNEEEIHESSVVTTANDELIDRGLNYADSSNNSFRVLLYMAGLLVKVIGFQINILVSFVTYPVWFMYSSYMFITDPFRIARRCKAYFIRVLLRILGWFRGKIMSIIRGWVKENNSTWKMVLRFGWGLLWSAYVCFVLVGLLVSAFVVCGIMMSYVVEEPLQMKEDLNFDYTKDSPAAFVPIMSCPEFTCLDCREKTEIENIGGTSPRVIRPNHKLQATVSLRLPESDYNRNLGIFQLRVDFLSANGKPLASLRQPTMLQFKSLPVRLLLTFFKMAPLATGYSSETQTLNIKFRGFTERNVPTSCLRVVMEQRAEFHTGAGIPEIYEASLNLESELPLLKRILWSWKRTIFVWISILMFTIELLFTLVCCKCILVSRVRLRGGSSLGDNNNNPSQRNHPNQM